MNYWVTTHWPPRSKQDFKPGGVYVLDKKQHIIKGVKVGDLVWIYQSGSGKTIIRENADGTKEKVPCIRGRQGIIALCKVTDNAYTLDDSTPENYIDGSSKWWKWHAPTKNLNTTGFIPRRELALMLNYNTEYTFRGFGDDNSGLKKIESSEHEALLSAFKASIKVSQNKKLEEIAGSKHSKGGEGPFHKKLKEAIASEPSLFLKEEGLSLVRIEYPFPTGDRIDVLLTDKYGRYVAVEVEPNCDKYEICGPLQCMKYRSMLNYVLGVPLGESRAVLASPSIHSRVHKKCRKYDIETVITTI